MNGLKRFTSRLTASFDWLVQQVENHEALVSSTIQEVSHHAAKASIQVKRVERDGAQLKERLLRLRENIQLWEERAKEKKDTDSQMALQCLRRRKKLLAEASQVEVQLVEHKKVEQQLKEEVSLLREKLEELKRKRNLMRTRQSRALAVSACPESETQIVSEIEDVFDRWESRIAEYELQGATRTHVCDQFEEGFRSEEEERELRAELQSL